MKSNHKIEEIFALIPKPSDPEDIKLIKDMIKHYQGSLLRGFEDEAQEVGNINATYCLQFV